VLVDGAHAPGMVPLAIDRMAPSFYTGNFHKWICAPKGAAMLWVREDWRSKIHPTSISHGFTARTPRGALHDEFDWTGTDDPSPWLLVGQAARTMERNRQRRTEQLGALHNVCHRTEDDKRRNTDHQRRERAAAVGPRRDPARGTHGRGCRT
jgi:selenocysteine lyase/cysteine desulfurase